MRVNHQGLPLESRREDAGVKTPEAIANNPGSRRVSRAVKVLYLPPVGQWRESDMALARQALPAHGATGMTPTYFARGRINWPVAYCSIAWPTQPMVRPMAKTVSGDPDGRRRTRVNAARAKSTVGF